MLSSSIKIENTAIAKKERLSKSPTKSHTCTIGDVNDINYTGLFLLGTTMIAIVSLPSRQKNDKYYKVTYIPTPYLRYSELGCYTLDMSKFFR